MTRIIRNRLAFALLGLSLAIVPMAGSTSAQTTGDHATTATDTGVATTRTDRTDSGFNPSWLGLLGLLGLAGLMPKKTHVATTHRTGDTTTR